MRSEVEGRRRLQSLEALGEAVSAMKSLSAHHFREARRAVEPARAYQRGVERLLRGAGAPSTGGTGGAGLLVIGAELGLCGSYNAQVAAEATARRAVLGRGPTFCVGHRAVSLLHRRGVEVERAYTAPTRVAGITGLLLSLAEDVLGRYAADRLASFDIVSSRFEGVGLVRPASTRLLPSAGSAAEATYGVRYVSQDAFVFAATREFLYITLHDLLLDALASEHGARLFATQSAEKWLDEQATRLRRRLAATRREASTQEVMEIAAGARARAAEAPRLDLA
ncbi:hypothetical protein HPC50_15695 [Corallococcus exiguus]|uniref:F0F1 ATP synthase subunit gamma n=1 Tax=Corallococcus TaxID=83461 RepID=UPI00131571D3|nr:F0F1 ATP synthase subunit gamma [Corallococcus sp. AB032C]NPC48507.1 hypothetical protein [Corallococcus exiguus]